MQLQVGLQGTGGRHIKAVEVVQRAVEHGCQTVARQADALVGNDRHDGWLRYPVAVDRLAGQRGFGQWLLDHMVGGKHADVRIGEFGQLDPALGQVVGRAALGNHQRQHLAQGKAACSHAFGVTGSGIQGLVDLVEVGAVPHPQAFGHAVHFAVPGHGRQRHTVEVVAHDALACFGGIRAALVGTHAGRNHLADFLGTRHGQAVR
ncbi:hypothetical protein D3C76_991200 [compost metagenome]